MTQSAKATPPDRRLFDRFRLDLPARFLSGGQEHGGAVLLDVSAAGAALRARQRPRVGEDVVIYADAGIRLAGRVVRWFAQGFAIRFEPNASRIERMLVRLGLKTPAARAAAIVPEPGEGPRCRRADGTPIDGTVTSVSVVGVSVASRERPALGTPVVIGRAEGSVVRHTAEGFTVEFDGYWDTSARNNRLDPGALTR